MTRLRVLWKEADVHSQRLDSLENKKFVRHTDDFLILKQQSFNPIVQNDFCFLNIKVFFFFCWIFKALSIIEPPHDKTKKWHMCPAKTQISLDVRPVYSEFSLPASRKLGSLATLQALSEVSDQTGRMPRLIWVFAGRTCHFVGFVMRRSYC